MNDRPDDNQEFFDDADNDAVPLSDLTPRAATAVPRRGLISTAVVAAIVLALVAIVWVFLKDASLFVYEADDAIANRAELNDDRFRLIGSPIDNIETFTIDGENAAAFTVVFDDVLADVLYVGPEPSELFKPGIPVFLEGHWVQGSPDQVEAFSGGANDGYYFLGDELRVKHDNDYTDNNEERLEEAQLGGEK